LKQAYLVYRSSNIIFLNKIVYGAFDSPQISTSVFNATSQINFTQNRLKKMNYWFRSTWSWA